MPATAPAKVAPEPAVPPVKQKQVRLGATALYEELHRRRRFFVKAPPGATQDDCRSTHFLALVADKLVRHDLLFVLSDAEDWELELCVEKVLRCEVLTTVRKAYARTSIADTSRPVDDAGLYRAEYRPGLAWCIVRNSDNNPTMSGHIDASAAVAAWRSAQPRPVLQ